MADAGRVEFSKDQRVQLMNAFDQGMNSARKEKLGEIRELASKMGVEECKIKNWIGNERAKRKRSQNEPPETKAKKPPQKLRAPNCYNVFTKDFFQSPEGKEVTDLGLKNRKAAEKWKELTLVEKDKYKQIASQASVANDEESAHFDKWHETQRILANLQGNCQWAERFGVHVTYMVCNEKNHYVGGTQSGRKYLEANPHIPTSFLVSTRPGVTPQPKEPSSNKELRLRVQQQLNSKYSLAVGDSLTTVPYKALKPENVIGLPSGVTLSHPSNMSLEDLQTVYGDMSSIKFVGVPPKQPEHSYAKDCTTAPFVKQKKAGFTTLTPKGGQGEIVLAETQTTSNGSTESDPECTIGATVKLLTKEYRAVGTAVTMTGDTVHRHKLPDGFVKVAVQTIDSGIKPQVRGIDDDLSSGCITAWPLKFTRRS